MAEKDKHIDEAFKNMSEKYNVSYSSAFWDEAKTKLDDSLLDDAFKAAAAGVVTSPSFEATDGVDDMFMDSAFVDASVSQVASYEPSFFEQFIANEGDISMDEAFAEASVASVANYAPEYWPDANEALIDEGLHFEYQSSYWKEAKRLLDKQDRRLFFLKWSSVAAVLLLISFSGQFLNPIPVEIDGMLANSSQEGLMDYESTHLSNMNIYAAHEALMADKEFANYISLNGLSQNTTGSEDLAIKANESNVNVEHSYSVDESNTSELLSNNESNVIHSDVNSFESIGINHGLAEQNKIEDEVTFMNIGTHLKTPIKHIGYTRFNPLIKINPPPPSTMHSLGVIVESGIGNRWGDFSFMPTLRTGIGIEYLASSGKKFRNFEFGGNFKVNHIRQSQLGAEERSDVYDVQGNVTKYWRKLQLKDMIYTNINGLVNYRIAVDHKLKFGVGIDYLVGVRSNMSYVDDFTSEITTVNNNWGVKEGVNKVDLKLSIGYEYEISERFKLQINSSFGVFDRTDDSFLNDPSSDREINVMMGLKYNFLKIKK
jgi:hypothetical protein